MTGFLDLAAAAKFLARSPRWVRGNLSWIPHFRTNSQLLFRPDELLTAMERFREKPQVVDLSGLLNRVVPPPRPRGAKGRFGNGTA